MEKMERRREGEGEWCSERLMDSARWWSEGEQEGGRIKKKKGGPGERVGGRGNEKRNDRAAPDSAALIFNDILQRARVPLMHRHYDTPNLFSSFLPPTDAFSSRSFPSPPDNASAQSPSRYSRDAIFRAPRSRRSDNPKMWSVAFAS